MNPGGAVVVHKKAKASCLLMVDFRQPGQNQRSTRRQGHQHDSPVRLALLRTYKAALFRPFDQTHHGMYPRLKEFGQF